MRVLVTTAPLLALVLGGAPALAQDPPDPPPPPQAVEKAVPRGEVRAAKTAPSEPRMVRQADTERRDSGPAVAKPAKVAEQSVGSAPVSFSRDNDEDQGQRRGAVRRPPSGGGGSGGGNAGGAAPRARAVARSSPPPRDRDRDTVYLVPRSYYGGYYFDPFYSYSGYYGGPFGYLGYSPWGWSPAFYGSYGYGAGRYQARGWDVGSVKLKVRPRDAEVFVDGYYAGIVDDFDGAFQSLRLDSGAYTIEVRKAGFETVRFDVRVQPDRTITYRADMRGATP